MHLYKKYTFQQREELVHLTQVEASENLDTGIKTNIDELLQGPHARGSTPMDRCATAGAAGYQFKPK